MFLARKISRAKWNPKEELSKGEISADAVTADLRTEGNALSCWQCGGGTDAEVEEAVLAIAAAGDRIDKLDLVWFSDDELRADSQTLRNTDGRTAVTELAARHVDVCRLDYVRLGKVACRVVAAIEKDRWTRLTRASVKKILMAAAEQDRIDFDSLRESVRSEVQKSLGANPPLTGKTQTSPLV